MDAVLMVGAAIFLGLAITALCFLIVLFAFEISDRYPV